MATAADTTVERTPIWAWAISPGWRGSPELLAHIARAAGRALEDETGGRAQYEATVYVADDLERFDDPRTFRQDVTKDALKNFESIEFRVAGNGLQVAITLARRKRKHPDWFKRGVLIEVDGTATDAPDRKSALNNARTVRTKTLAAVKRGVSVEEQIKTGDSGEGQTAVATFRQERRRRHRRIIWTAAVGVPMCVAYLALLGAAPGQSDFPEWVLYTVVGGVAGAMPAVLGVWLRPSIELSDVTRAQRTMRTAMTAIGPVLGGALALAARLLS